jgi:monoamine oxidase
MSRTKEELYKMTDKELAILVKYKISNYLQPTQKEILIYSKERNLTEERIEKLTSDYKYSETRKPTISRKIKKYFGDILSGILEGI